MNQASRKKYLQVGNVEFVAFVGKQEILKKKRKKEMIEVGGFFKFGRHKNFPLMCISQYYSTVLFMLCWE